MNRLLHKVKDLEREAWSLIDQQRSVSIPSLVQHPNLPNWMREQQEKLCTCYREPFEGAGDGDWLRDFKNAVGSWNGKRLVVLSLFDGIGGVWAALTRLEIPYVGYSSEVCAPAVEVVKTRFPEVHHLGDVRKLERSAISENVDLLVGGFPCQDLSCMGKRKGLHGQRSRLFFDLLRAITIFRPKWFLVENVASMTWIDRVEISKYLEVVPLELDSIELTPTRRRRLYWTNIPHPPRLPRVRDHPSTLVQSCLKNAIALEEKTGVILGFSTARSNSCSLERAFEEKAERLRKVVQSEVERMMGFLPNHTDVMVRDGCNNYHTLYKKDKNSKTFRGGNRQGDQGDCEPSRNESLKSSVRWRLMGNTFSVPVIAYLLSPLLQRSVRDLARPTHISSPVLEKDASVMEIDDVWALYNEHERPNWYGLIVKRIGDRFSRRANAPKKQPLCIEMQYMEITPAYLVDEDDVWNPTRGTGLYEVRQEVDIQNSWTAFSHRVTSFIRSDNKVFIYPGRNEVWTVYCEKIWSPFFVYVVESTIDIATRTESARPGAEGFFARCRLIIKTGEHETYRRTEKVLEFTDLSLFIFQVPYTFKQESNLLKVEIGLGGRKGKKVETRIRKCKRKREKTVLVREKSDEIFLSEDEDAEQLEVLAEEQEAFNGLPEVVANRKELNIPSRGKSLEFEINLNNRRQIHHTLVPAASEESEESDLEFARFPPEIIIIDDD